MRKDYYQNKSVHYGIGHTRQRKILELVGDLRGKTVLDIGCASGYLGARVKQKGNYVAGVEVSQLAAQKAKEVLDTVYTFDLEREWPEEIKGRKFDLAIMAEIIEHVFDPTHLIKNVSHVLNKEAEIIVTTPNIISWPMRLKVVFGLFEYTDQGTLDFGHIRFFTYEYLKKILAASGFRVVKENHIISPGRLTRWLKYWPSVFATQFIIKAKKV